MFPSVTRGPVSIALLSKALPEWNPTPLRNPNPNPNPTRMESYTFEVNLNIIGLISVSELGSWDIKDFLTLMSLKNRVLTLNLTLIYREDGAR